MRTALLALLSAGLLLLSGCAAHYSVTEQQLTDYLNKELKFDVQQGNDIFGTKLKLNHVTVTLGQRPGTMSVTADSSIVINTPLLPLRASLTAEFDAKPWYDKTSQGIYLKDLQLTKIKSTPEDIEKAINQVSPELMRYIRTYLESQPVYILNTDHTDQALLARFTDQIRVDPGKLVLVFK